MDWSGIMRARKIRSVGFSQPRLLPRCWRRTGGKQMRCRRRASPPFFFAVRLAAGPGRRTPAKPSTGRSRPRPAPRRPAPQPAGRKRPRCRPLPQRLAARGTGGSGCHRPALRAVRSAEATGELARRRQAHGSGWGPGVPAPETPGHRQPRPRGQTPTVSSAAKNVPPSVGKRGLVSRV